MITGWGLTAAYLLLRDFGSDTANPAERSEPPEADNYASCSMTRRSSQVSMGSRRRIDARAVPPGSLEADQQIHGAFWCKSTVRREEQAMRGPRQIIGATALATALVVGAPTAALAFDRPPGDFGRMVAMCARDHLGQQTNAPTVTCTCPDGTMTFANFAGMVAAMKRSNCTCTDCC